MPRQGAASAASVCDWPSMTVRPDTTASTASSNATPSLRANPKPVSPRRTAFGATFICRIVSGPSRLDDSDISTMPPAIPFMTSTGETPVNTTLPVVSSSHSPDASSCAPDGLLDRNDLLPLHMAAAFGPDLVLDEQAGDAGALESLDREIDVERVAV